MSAESSPILSFDSVAYQIGDRVILKDISVGLARGRVLGLLGANGAGKTTLLRIATRVAMPATGVVRLSNTPIGELSRRELAQRVAIVPQDTHIPFPFSALEVVLMGRAPHQPLFGFESPEDLDRAADAMDQMGVAHLADRSILEVSGGERQLVMLARAFAQEPEVLLLDEPTAFLDLRHRIAVLEAVRNFASAGGSVLLVSHDLGLAARACDDIALLADGVIGRSGTPSDVLTAEAILETFGISAEVVPAPDGSPLVVPAFGPTPGPADD